MRLRRPDGGHREVRVQPHRTPAGGSVHRPIGEYYSFFKKNLFSPILIAYLLGGDVGGPAVIVGGILLAGGLSAAE